MKRLSRLFVPLILGFTCCFASEVPEPKWSLGPVGPPIEIPIVPQANSVHQPLPEFHDEEISLALRALAKQGGLSISIAPTVTGKVTMRFQQITERKAIDAIVKSKDLMAKDKDGVLYVSAKHPASAQVKPASIFSPSSLGDPNSDKPLDQQITEALGGPLNEIFTKMSDAYLDYMARPETAQKIGKAEKNLYDALIAEGFSKDDAMRILLNTPVLNPLGIGK